MCVELCSFCLPRRYQLTGKSSFAPFLLVVCQLCVLPLRWRIRRFILWWIGQRMLVPCGCKSRQSPRKNANLFTESATPVFYWTAMALLPWEFSRFPSRSRSNNISLVPRLFLSLSKNCYRLFLWRHLILLSFPQTHGWDIFKIFYEVTCFVAWFVSLPDHVSGTWSRHRRTLITRMGDFLKGQTFLQVVSLCLGFSSFAGQLFQFLGLIVDMFF